MSPLLKGTENIKANVMELMNPVKSKSRKKAIMTISKSRNISEADAQFVQAKAIAISQARKK